MWTIELSSAEFRKSSCLGPTAASRSQSLKTAWGSATPSAGDGAVLELFRGRSGRRRRRGCPVILQESRATQAPEVPAGLVWRAGAHPGGQLTDAGPQPLAVYSEPLHLGGEPVGQLQ